MLSYVGWYVILNGILFFTRNFLKQFFIALKVACYPRSQKCILQNPDRT